MKINKSPESFVIRDLDYSIVSCSPETLIEKKSNIIKTKPIAGTMQKNHNTTRLKAKKYFRLPVMKAFAAVQVEQECGWKKIWAPESMKNGCVRLKKQVPIPWPQDAPSA